MKIMKNIISYLFKNNFAIINTNFNIAYIMLKKIGREIRNEIKVTNLFDAIISIKELNRRKQLNKFFFF